MSSRDKDRRRKKRSEHEKRGENKKRSEKNKDREKKKQLDHKKNREKEYLRGDSKYKQLNRKTDSRRKKFTEKKARENKQNTKPTKSKVDLKTQRKPERRKNTLQTGKLDKKHSNNIPTINRNSRKTGKLSNPQDSYNNINFTSSESSETVTQISSDQETMAFVFIYEANGVYYSTLDGVIKTDGRIVTIHPVYYTGYNNNMSKEDVVYNEDNNVYLSGSDNGSWLDVIYQYPDLVYPITEKEIIRHDGSFFYSDDDLLHYLLGKQESQKVPLK